MACLMRGLGCEKFELSILSSLLNHKIALHRFNKETLQFERSWWLRLRSYLVAFLKATMPLKLTASWLFEQNHDIQLFIGKEIFLGGSLGRPYSLTTNSMFFLSARKSVQFP